MKILTFQGKYKIEIIPGVYVKKFSLMRGFYDYETSWKFLAKWKLKRELYLIEQKNPENWRPIEDSHKRDSPKILSKSELKSLLEGDNYIFCVFNNHSNSSSGGL